MTSLVIFVPKWQACWKKHLQSQGISLRGYVNLLISAWTGRDYSEIYAQR